MYQGSDNQWPEIRASKIEAAKRELNAGIRLLFDGEDALAVHTLAFAAYGLLVGLSEAAGKTKTLRRLEADSTLKEGKEFWQELKRLANFLKHADRDPDDVIVGIPEEFNETILFVNCSILRELNGLASVETQALWLWHHAIYFINIDDAPPAYWEWIENYHTHLHAESRAEKIQIGKELLYALHCNPLHEYRMEPEQTLLPWRLVIRPTSGSRRRS